MSDYRTYVTQTGFGLERDAKFNNSHVDLAVLVIGDGALADSASPAERTDLIHQVREYGLTIEKDEKDSNVWIARAEIPASDGGFFIKEAGVKTKDGYLYAYARQAGDYKPLLEEGQGKSYTIRLKFIPGNADSIQIKIDPSVQFATPTDLENLKKEHSEDRDPHPQYETDEGAAAKANSALSSAKNYTDSKTAEMLSSAKSDATTKSNNAISSAKSYTDSKATETLNSAKADATTKSNNALSSAKNYTDSTATETLNLAKADATTKSNNALSSAKSYTDSKATETLNSAKADATTKSNNAISSAKSYTDSKATETLNSAKADATTKSNNTLSSAKNYTDSKSAEVLNSAKVDASTKANSTLNSAKNYTDSKASETLSTAKSDATSKANTALSSAKRYVDRLRGQKLFFSVLGDENHIILISKEGVTPITELNDYDEFSFIVSATNTAPTVTIKFDGLDPIAVASITSDTQLIETALATVCYIDGSLHLTGQINPKTGNPVSLIGRLITSPFSFPGACKMQYDGGELRRDLHPILFALARKDGLVNQATKDADLKKYGARFGDGDGVTTFTILTFGGAFIRFGNGDITGLDNVREIGSYQEHAIEKGSFTIRSDAGGSSLVSLSTGSISITSSSGNISLLGHSGAATQNLVTIGSEIETRPSNYSQNAEFLI